MQAVTLNYLLNWFGFACLFVGIVFLWFELTERRY